MSLVLRNVKGSKLTISESDGNLTYLEGLINSGGSGGGLVQLIGTGSIDLSLVPVEQGQSLLYGGWFGTFSSGEVLYNYDTNSEPDVLIGSASISNVYKHGELNDEKGSGLTYSYGYLLLENVVGTMSGVSKGVWSTDNPYTNESVNFLPEDNPLDINYSTQTAIEQEISIVEGDWIITQVLLVNPQLDNLDNTLISTGNVSPYDSCLDTFVFVNNKNGSVLNMNNANDFFLRTLYLPDFPGNQSFNIKPTITSNAVIFSVFVGGAIIPSGVVDVVIYGFQKPL